ncbi:MAG TPA: FtsX-like permease family protein, partial [Planctomycetaceae bacterium]|nr:FtsX-like permease family protein [Planctomycetaceae bacterium]
AHFNATIVDVFKSGMSEYDSSLVFCNLDYLQQVRGMVDPASGERSFTSIQIKLKDYRDADEVVERLRAAFPAGMYSIRTWEQKQGPLLAAVEVESAILNVLLFLIIAVAGFGILAIFFMIVVEKTRDIGILKSLGASRQGVMSIFLSYGLSLGMVGSGVGTIAGLLFVYYINEIEKLITWVTGHKVFDERIYYFPTIPTHVSPMMVLWVSVGAMLIAVLASILPARRAASLQPVRALRYE